VLTLGVLNGMLAAVALSVARCLHLFAAAHQRAGARGRRARFRRHAPASRRTRPARRGHLRPNAPLFFANAEGALAEVARMAASDGAQTIVLSLEQSADLDSTAAEALGEFVSAESRPAGA
jgi:MFS superfamily sulfate permease-like transporter